MNRCGRHAELERALEMALVGEAGKAGEVRQRIATSQELAGLVDPAVQLIGVRGEPELAPEVADEPERAQTGDAREMDQRDALEAMGVQIVPNRPEVRGLGGGVVRPVFPGAEPEKRAKAAAEGGAALIRPAGRAQGAFDPANQPACCRTGENALRPGLFRGGTAHATARPSGVEIEHPVAPRLIGPGIARVDLAGGQDDDIARPQKDRLVPQPQGALSGVDDPDRQCRMGVGTVTGAGALGLPAFNHWQIRVAPEHHAGAGYRH